jgi:hypothetical protein
VPTVSPLVRTSIFNFWGKGFLTEGNEGNEDLELKPSLPSFPSVKKFLLQACRKPG